MVSNNPLIPPIKTVVGNAQPPGAQPTEGRSLPGMIDSLIKRPTAQPSELAAETFTPSFREGSPRPAAGTRNETSAKQILGGGRSGSTSMENPFLGAVFDRPWEGPDISPK